MRFARAYDFARAHVHAHASAQVCPYNCMRMLQRLCMHVHARASTNISNIHAYYFVYMHVLIIRFARAHVHAHALAQICSFNCTYMRMQQWLCMHITSHVRICMRMLLLKECTFNCMRMLQRLCMHVHAHAFISMSNNCVCILIGIYARRSACACL